MGVQCWGATFIWNGGGANANWSNGTNWNGGIAPTNNGTAAIVLAGTTQLSPNVDTNWDISSLTFSNGAGVFILGGGALNIRAGGVTNGSANGQIINNAITLWTNQTWNAISNPLTFNGSITNTDATNLLTISGSFNSAISGVISGTGGLIKTGTGTNFLSGANTFSGVTTVSAGALNLQNNSALGSAGGGNTTVASGAQLQLQGGITVAGEALTISGTGLAGSGALRSLGGSNTWNGTITLAAAATIDADAGTLNLTANIINSTFLTTFANNGIILLNGVLGGGTGGLTMIGTGLLQLDGANTYTGATTVSSGTVQFGATGSLSSTTAVTVSAAGILALNGFNESILSLAGAGGVTLGGGTLMVNNTAATTYSGVMSGAGGLAKAGTATFTMSGVNTYTGGTTINLGAISIAAATALGNATNLLTLNGGELTASVTMTFAQPIFLGTGGGVINVGNTTLTLPGTISGPGFLIKIGAKTLALTGANTYLGSTTNTAGTITVNADAALGDPGGTLTFSNTATLTTTASFTSSRNVVLNAGIATFSCGTGFTNTFNGVISGAGALTQSGAGVMVLGGGNTFTNLLTIGAGTVRLGASGGISALCPVVIGKSSAILDLNNFNATIGSLASTAAGKVTLENGSLTAGGNNATTTNSAVISGTGGFTKAGTGLLVLSGANTYTNTTTVGGGTLQLSASTRLAVTSPLVVSNGAVFNLNSFNQTVASLAGAGSVTLGSGTLTAGNASSPVFSGAISGTGAFTKVGTGTQTFSGTNSYSGATTVSVGNLQVNGSSPNSAVTMASAATLSGNGVVGTVAVNSGATNSPGGSAPGTMTSGAQTWAAGGNYLWDINNPTGSAGGSSGWDWLNISGTLTINATGASKFNLNLVSLTTANADGVLTNFDNTATYIWTIASTSGGITGFNAANFNINASGFQNSLGAGSFALSQSGNNLNLIFTSAAAAAIKDVQSGTLTSTGNGTNTVTLGAGVNPTNSFLIFNTRHNSPVPGGSMIGGIITSSNSVQFVRATTETSTMNIQWYVVEYAAGVRVQRGEVNQTNTTINIPLSPVSAVNQAFVTWSKTPDPAETAFTDSDPLVGQITSTTNLQFRVGAAPSSVPVIYWQVVEFQNPASISVQTDSVTNLTGTNLLATDTLPAPVNTNSTFLLTGYRTSGSGTSIGARMLRAQLTGASTVTFDRDISGAPDNVSEIFWQAVQLNDGSSVQGGSVNFTNGVAETNVTLISLNTNRAAAFASVQPAGGQNTGRSPSTGTVLGVGSATLALTSISQLTLDRNNTSDQLDAGWFVVGFGPGSLLVPATGGTAISADTTGNAYTSLTGPVYTEIQSGNVGTGTIILNAPAGFVFATNAPQPAVIVTRFGGSGANSLNLNGVASGTSVAMTTINPTNLTFTVTSASSGGVTCMLTWTNLSVRPSAGTPLASGNLMSMGTSVIQGVTTNSTGWGFLNEVVGAATKLAIVTQPSAAATAGVNFPQQPVVQVQDQFGNLRTADNTTVVTASTSGTDTNDVNGPMTVVGGVAAFSGLDYLIAETNTITFSAPGLTSKTSSNVVVSAAAASQVTDVTQPSATAVAGVNFAQQPVVQVQDQYGNLVKTDNSTVTASIDQGSGNLFGTLSFKAVNGVATFTNLSYQVAETITIDFTDGSLDIDTSVGTVVGAAPASQLVIQTQPSATATAGVPFAQQPVIQVLDQFGNLCATNNSTVVTASRDAGGGSGVLQGGVNVTASGGVATFANLSHNVATTLSVDFNSGGLTGATSSSILVSPAAVAALAFATQPGSATVGSIFGIQPALITEDAFGNSSVSGLANSLSVTLALTSGFGALQGTTSLDIGTGAGNGTVAFSNLEIDSAGSKQLTASAGGLASAVSASFSVAQGSQTITFGSLANQIYGVAPFVVSASASSGLPVIFSVVSGPASVTSSNVTITGTGTVTLSASQPGNTNYLAATPVNQSFTVTPAVLTVTANNTNRIYGAANPIFTASYSGFVNGDNSSVLSGVPAFNTAATTTSTVAGSPYSITVTNGTLGATNYSFSFVSGQLTVTPASSALAVSTSANPSPTGSNVTFTATVTAVSPGSGTATGTIQFLADGAALGSPAGLSGGVASVSTASLSHATHLISAQYAGDGNFFGSTNSLSPNEVINSAPVAGISQLQRYPNFGAKVRVETLLANDNDPDGDPLSLVSVSPASANGGTISLSGDWIDYEPPTGFTNADNFSYIIADSGGLQATGTVSVVILAAATQSQNIAGITNLGNGSTLIQFNGIPGRTYSVQATTNLVTPNWQWLGAATAGLTGQFNFTDTPPTNSPPRFYSSTYP
jgi:fibronectin-binding autotransporter adhesin